jgi:hypothetical protein
MPLNACLVIPCDFVGDQAQRLPLNEIRELQDMHNVNTCNNDWFDSDEIGNLTIMEELEFWERYGD